MTRNERWQQLMESFQQLISEETTRIYSETATEPTTVEEACGNEFQPLRESVLKEGKGRIRIIAPGKGSSGIYPEEMLRRDGPLVFVAGTKMFADHPSATEAKTRPERSIRDIVATLESDAVYEESGPVGPGLYADINVMPDWRERVEALAPHIGVSIRTAGKGRKTEEGTVIESLIRTPFTSVDFVTEAGAGGKILNELYESVRAKADEQPEPATESKTAGDKPADSHKGEATMENLHESAVRIAKLCKLAGKPELTHKFLEENKSADEVAEILLEAKAKKDEETTVSSHPDPLKESATDNDALVKIAEARAAKAAKKEGR